jgi:hypothetical protein
MAIDLSLSLVSPKSFVVLDLFCSCSCSCEVVWSCPILSRLCFGHLPIFYSFLPRAILDFFATPSYSSLLSSHRGYILRRPLAVLDAFFFFFFFFFFFYFFLLLFFFWLLLLSVFGFTQLHTFVLDWPFQISAGCIRSSSLDS